jgi:putative ABC transport system permease protein
VSAFRVFLARVRGWFRWRTQDDDLREEIASHIDEATGEFIRQGLDPADARRQALRAFGGVSQMQDAYREQLSFRWLDHLGRDLRHSARALARTPGFSVVVLTVLSVGIGAVLGVFALLNRIVLQPLPYAQSDRLVVISHAAPGLKRDSVPLSEGLFFHYRAFAQSLESLGVYTKPTLQSFRDPGSGTERIQVTYASHTLFDALGVAPALGRLFTEEDGRPGFMNMKWTIPILVAHDFWVSHLGRDPNAVGRILTLSDNPRRVIGVMPEGFTFPDAHTQVWMLLEPSNDRAAFARSFRWENVGRLRAGATVASAQAELAHLLPQLEGRYADATAARIAEVQLRPLVVPLKSAIIGDVAAVLWPLFGGMALLLLMAGANAASLFLVRADNRRREIAVRLALGAGSRHVALLFLTESLAITATAAALGLLLARGLLWAVMTLAPLELPRTTEIRLDATAMLFAVVVAVLMAMFYTASGLRQQDRSAAASLRDSEHWTTQQRAARRWARDPLLVLQVALALSLMVGSGLMLETYRNLARRDLGFSASSLLTIDVSLPFRNADRHVAIYQGLIDRLRQLPGVESASAASFMPLTPSQHMFPTEMGSVPVPFKFVAPGYFQTMGTAITRGERLAAGEPVSGMSPVLVSEALARRLYPSGDAIGQPIRRLNEDGTIVTLREPVPPFEIAGLVGDVREMTLRGAPTEIVYIPLIEPSVERSIVPTDMTFVLRTRVAPLSLARAVKETINDLDPSLSVGQVRTMESIVRAARGKETFVGALLLVAAAASLLLGVVGIYGGVAQVVRRRRRELGIRIALGASRHDVLAMVVRGTLWAVVAGATLGLAIALTGSRVLGTLLFGVGPRDPLILSAVTLVLAAAAVAAALVAGRRASRIAPIVAIREG